MGKVIVIVNYNKDIMKSKSIISLNEVAKKNLDSVKIFIWDNVKKKENLKKLEENFSFKNFEYKGVEENYSLSEIYNYTFEKYKNKVDYFILFDNDSIIEDKYFIELENALKKNKNIDLYLPTVVVNKVIVSPARMLFFKGSYLKDIKVGEKKAKYTTAINSGMVISNNFIVKENYSYDVRLKFYGTDDYFMKKYREKREKIYVFNYKMSHELAINNTEEDYEMKKWRFKDKVNGVRICHSDTICKMLIIELYIFILKIKFWMRNKKFKK